MSELQPLSAEDNTPAEALPVRSPGQVLRQARESRGLTIEAVAEVIRFSERQIEFIEQDNYQALPGATLVRGFIRGYAKFLRLDPAPLLAQLDVLIPSETSDIRPPTNIGAAADNQSAESVSPKLIFGGLLVLIGVLVGGYIFTTTDDAYISSKMATEVAPEPAVATHNDAQVAMPPPPASAESVPTDAQADQPATGAAEAAVLAPGLVVEFDGVSWIEVRDAAQNIVFVGEYPKGTRQLITGTAPFSLWIGRASAVRATYQGRPVDIKSGSREDVARITVQ